MYLLRPIILLLAAVSSADAVSKPYSLGSASRHLAASNSILNTGLSEGHRLATSYGPPALEKAADITHSVYKGATDAAKWSTENPGLATSAVVAGAGIVVMAAPGIVSAPMLYSAGFTASGVKAGSSAALIHGTIGNVASGSAFAVGQSAGAGGAGLAIVNGVIQVGGGVATAASGGLAWVRSKL